MLNTHKDLESGQVYLFNDEEVRYTIRMTQAQYSDQLAARDRHVFTRWPITPGSHSAYFTSDQVDELIKENKLVAI